jgi:ubiquinone/menaquinone biosynthesis C-methylase UbiE
MENNFEKYKKMYEDFGAQKSLDYLDEKFIPKNLFGFDNFLREKKILEKINLDPNDVILDIGCASGRQIFLMSPYCKKAVGIDISPSFIEEGKKYLQRKNIKNVELLISLAEDIPFPENYFDKILCAELLEHVIDPGRVLKEIHRVLKRGGKLIITVPNLNSEGTFYGRIKRFLGIKKFKPLPEFSLESLRKHGNAHLREFDGKTLEELVKKYDFKIIYKGGINFLDWPGIDLMIRALNKLGIWQNFFLKIFLFFEFLLNKVLINFGRHLILIAEKS